MIKFVIHTSINARGYLWDYINRDLPAFEKEIGQKISLISSGHDRSKSWLMESINENRIPDVMLAHASEFSILDLEQTISPLFAPNSKISRNYPVRDEMKSFIDYEGLFHPICSVPLIMFYNRKNVSETDLCNSWTDLFNEKLRVVFPYEDIPISKVIMANLKNRFKKEFDEFRKNIVFGESPMKVINAVASGRYDMGVSNLYFFMISNLAQEESIAINWPREGLIPLPQVLVFKKDAHPQLFQFIDLLTSDEFQNFLSEQAFWPISGKSPLYGFFRENEWINSWQNWGAFLKMIQNLDQ